MTKGTSFKNFIINNYSTIINNYVENYFLDNKYCIKSKKLFKILEIVYDTSEIINVGVTDLPGDAVSFDIIVKSCFWAYGKSEYSDDDEEEIYQWFIINGKGNISKKLQDIQLLEISIYDEKLKKDKKLSDQLIPLIKKTELDNIANDFLKKYFPESINKPQSINPYIIAQKMGLNIEKHSLSKDCSIFGSIIFDDCSLNIWDNNKKKVQDFRKGTILVDPSVYYLRNLGSFNNTIIHECVHWELHKKAFEFEKIYNKDLNKITCFVNGKIEKSQGKTSDSYIEWQANEITPRIQAPKEMLIKKFRDYSKKYNLNSSRMQILESIEKIIDEISNYFNISRQSAKIRLIECGYNIACGAFTYIDNKYIKPFSYNKMNLSNNQTFSIGIEDLIIEAIKNPNLNELIEKGKLIYTNSFLCLNDSKYIKKNTHELTDYARLNVDECCLKFDINTKKSFKSNKYSKECILCRDINTSIIYKIEFDKNLNNDILLQSQAIIESERYINEGLDCLYNCLSKSLKAIMKWVDITGRQLADKSEISEKTIQRIRTGETTNPSIETMVALCIGLELPYKISLLFIETAGLKLICNTEEKMLYNFFLKDGCNFDIYECDELLKSKGFKGFIKE
ncbi:MAG: helix-turn-helix transcriptional regulator [Sphaerochaetaceae bacterium]|nr:helix-turn-helix transcriptional regulator [Sphaerochaetaceae bacterium]